MEQISRLYQKVTDGIGAASTGLNSSVTGSGGSASATTGRSDGARAYMARARTILERANDELKKSMRVDEEYSARTDGCTIVGLRAHVGTEIAHDGLPATLVTVKGEKRTVKFGTCARYSIAGIGWKALGKRLNERSPVAEMERIGGATLVVLGLWRFEVTTMHGHMVTIDACMVDGLQPIAYASSVNNDTVAKYSMTELECLAVVWSVKLFRLYLYGRRFLIRTDHAALKRLMTARDLARRLHRWV